MMDQFGDQVDWTRAQSWIGFGGIRIEDDVAVTNDEPEVLTTDIPKTPDEIEALVGTQQLGAIEAISSIF